MDRARGPTRGVFTQNLHGTHTSAANASGRRYVAAELIGGVRAARHLATSAKAADRGIVMLLSDEIYSPTPQENNTDN